MTITLTPTIVGMVHDGTAPYPIKTQSRFHPSCKVQSPETEMSEKYLSR